MNKKQANTSLQVCARGRVWCGVVWCGVGVLVRVAVVSCGVMCVLRCLYLLTVSAVFVLLCVLCRVVSFRGVCWCR